MTFMYPLINFMYSVSYADDTDLFLSGNGFDCLFDNVQYQFVTTRDWQ